MIIFSKNNFKKIFLLHLLCNFTKNLKFTENSSKIRSSLPKFERIASIFNNLFDNAFLKVIVYN